MVIPGGAPAVTSPDRGATAVLVAGSLLMLMGFAAVAVDVGRGFIERRVDQTVADVAATAGGVEVLVGAAGTGVTEDDMVEAALEYARLNLPTEYSDPEWQALWEGCTDPNRNTQPGDNFVALSPPSGWNVADPANWCMSIDAAKSLFRVRIPDQVVDTTFGRLLGVTELTPSASAVVGFDQVGGGVLPFGIPSGVGDGVQHCLSTAPPGLVNDPCDFQDSGNFGVLKVRIFGDSPYNGCNAAPTNPVLALNIAAGIDHQVVPAPNTDPANEVRDICYNPLVNTLETDPGFPSGVEWGLATGWGLPAGETARLQQGPQTKQNVVGHGLDDSPLWNWLKAQGEDGVIYGSNAPASCDPAGFPPDLDEDNYDFGWELMQQCLTDYVAGSYDTVIFRLSLGDRDGNNWSARFGYTPQFHQASLGPGITWRHIWRFRAVFIQGTWWKRGNSWVVHHPGDGCVNANAQATACTAGGNFQLWQVSAWIIPDAALPDHLKGDPPGAAIGINPFSMLLER